MGIPFDPVRSLPPTYRPFDGALSTAAQPAMRANAPAAPAAPVAPVAPVAPFAPFGLEPAYHPQVQPPGAQRDNPYALPPEAALADIAGGRQAQAFDVTLSQLATAVYGTRGGPPAGWSELSDASLQERGIADPAAWRHQFLGGGEQTTQQEFRAEIYTDGRGNYVLAYRGTAEGLADWENNFRQGTGFSTDPVDKFSGTAVNTAVEFQRVFGNDGARSDNLAITGHSQGGGLATVGSLATGVPAVTFDASGIHPNTFDRMGLDPTRAREAAEGGQIRAYSLHSDLLTRQQEAGPLGLVMPDALGTRIVVQPARADAHAMFNRYGPIELHGRSRAELGLINAAVEAGRHTPFLPVNPWVGALTGGANVVGNLAYDAISHSPNALTAAMVDHRPWQPGYENPADPGKALQNLLPEAAKDDYARNTHDLIANVADVARTDFMQGDPVQGAFRIGGDVAEGVWNSVGDTAHRGAESLARAVDARVDGLLGDALAGAIDLGGDVVHGTADAVGSVAEKVWDGVGSVAQKGADFVGWLTGH